MSIRDLVPSVVTMVALLFASGCGGASTSSSTSSEVAAETAKAPQTPATPPNATPGKTEPKPIVEDPQATQAAAFCQHDVENSAIRPSDQLDKKQINACLIAIRPDIARDCSKGVAREIVLKIIIEKTGTVTGAFPIGDFSDSPEAACISEKVKTVIFPSFIATPQQVIEKYPFTITP